MSLEETVRHLSRVPLFAQIEPEALRLLAFSAETLVLARNDVLFGAGDASDGGYVVLAGRLAVEMPGMAPRSIGPDTLLGETALLVATLRPATARALESAHVLKIPRALFTRVLAAFPDGAVRVRSFLAARLEEFAGELDGMRYGVLEEREPSGSLFAGGEPKGSRSGKLP